MDESRERRDVATDMATIASHARNAARVTGGRAVSARGGQLTRVMAMQRYARRAQRGAARRFAAYLCRRGTSCRCWAALPTRAASASAARPPRTRTPSATATTRRWAATWAGQGDERPSERGMDGDGGQLSRRDLSRCSGVACAHSPKRNCPIALFFRRPSGTQRYIPPRRATSRLRRLSSRAARLRKIFGELRESER